MQQRHVDLSHVEILILDEADQMLDMGFLPDLKRIVARVPRERQTLMFSATMPDEIRRLAAQWLREPVQVQAARVAAPAEGVEQSVYFVEPRDKPHLLARFLLDTPHTRTLVFARTKHGADKIVRHLVKGGIHAAAIHGNKSQSARQRVLEQFKSSRPPVLVATDIAARGLDIDAVSHVINFDLPVVPELYVHRIGRTARAGASGIAVSFCGRDERSHLKAIERLTRKVIRIERTELPPREESEAPARSPAPRGKKHRRDQDSPAPSPAGNKSRRRRRRPAPTAAAAAPSTAAPPRPAGRRKRRYRTAV